MKRSLYKYVWRSFFMGEIAEIKHKFYLSYKNAERLNTAVQYPCRLVFAPYSRFKYLCINITE